MPGWKKLQLALILIVDGVLIAHEQKTRPTLKYVKMVQNVDAFCQLPWEQGVFSEDHYLHETSPGMQRPNRRACLSVEAGFFQTQGIPPIITTSCISSCPTTSDHNPCASCSNITDTNTKPNTIGMGSLD
ncbi:unnamed protein product [Brassica oleracea var. botrytis]